MSDDIQNIMFQCSYNNGGRGIYTGFDGTCSDEIIKWNIKKEHKWCKDKNCECMQYYKNGFKGKHPFSPCYESRLFSEWRYGAGWNLTRNGPRHINKTGIGKIAIITTLFPNDKEKDRKIVGIFKIGNIENDTETMICADEYFRIKLPEEEAKELYFWDYYKSENSDDFKLGQGLFKYITDMQVTQILKDISETIKNEKEKIKIMQLLDKVKKTSGIKEIPRPNGLRTTGVTRTLQIARTRKYGNGGEGAAHKALKKWIAENPSFLELSKITGIEVEEHKFLSGDLPDIVFKIEHGKYAVVEIETIDPFPGAYQALKYRALLCAELGLDFNSGKVKAFLVAWKIPKEVDDFCVRYGIRTIEKNNN
jgi:hypothetical protein